MSFASLGSCRPEMKLFDGVTESKLDHKVLLWRFWRSTSHFGGYDWLPLSWIILALSCKEDAALLQHSLPGATHSTVTGRDKVTTMMTVDFGELYWLSEFFSTDFPSRSGFTTSTNLWPLPHHSLHRSLDLAPVISELYDYQITLRKEFLSIRSSAQPRVFRGHLIIFRLR
jgi:hypothetical protein